MSEVYHALDPGWFQHELYERTKCCDFAALVTTWTDGENGGEYSDRHCPTEEVGVHRGGAGIQATTGVGILLSGPDRFSRKKVGMKSEMPESS